MDPEFRVAFRPGCAKGAIYVSRAEPGAVRALPEAVENRQVVLAARLGTDNVEQVCLERLSALTGQLTEPVAQFFGNVTNLKGNHACNNTCKRAHGAGRAVDPEVARLPGTLLIVVKTPGPALSNCSPQ